MSLIVALDYDDTLVQGQYPEYGEFNEDVLKQALLCTKLGVEVILWTCRDGKPLEEAIQRCNSEGLYFVSHNKNAPSQDAYAKYHWDESKGEIFCENKIYADLYIDDKSPGSIEYFLSLSIDDILKLCEKFESRISTVDETV